MTIYLKINDKADYDWLLRLIDNWLAYDPNNPRLQANIEHIVAWRGYLTNTVTVADLDKVLDDSQLKTVLAEKDVEKVKAKKAKIVEPVPKKRGRPPKAKTLAARKQEEKELKKRIVDANPFACVDHPTYGGQRRPRTDCSRCWEVYKKFHPVDWKTVYAAFQRDQKKRQIEQ